MWTPTHVQVTVQKAKGLLFKGKNGTNDAFVTISLGKESPGYQTSVKERSVDPVEWHEECELAIPRHGNKAEIMLTILHRSFIGVEFLGRVTIPLSDFDVYDKPKNRWYNLKCKPGQDKTNYRGEIEVRVNFTVQAGVTAAGSLTELKKDGIRASFGQLSQKVGSSIVKMTGDMMVSFPAGIIQVFANNPSPAQLSFHVRSLQPLDNLISNKELANVETVAGGLTFEFNMSALVVLLKNHAEQNPQASYFNIDILKYHISPKAGASSCPLHLVAFWKCETSRTDLRIDYKYNSHAMAKTALPDPPPSAGSGLNRSASTETCTYPPLLQVCVAAPVDGGVKSMQSKPTGQWFPNTNRACWKIPSLSYSNENQGIGSLRARFEINTGPSTAGTIAAQFSCENSTLSGCDFQISGAGYRVSLIKKRFVSGKYTCEAVDSASRYAVPPGPGGDSGIQI